MTSRTGTTMHEREENPLACMAKKNPLHMPHASTTGKMWVEDRLFCLRDSLFPRETEPRCRGIVLLCSKYASGLLPNKEGKSANEIRNFGIRIGSKGWAHWADA